MCRIYRNALVMGVLSWVNISLFAQFGISTTLTINKFSGTNATNFATETQYLGSISGLTLDAIMAGYTKYLNKGSVQLFFEPQFGFHTKKFRFKHNLEVAKVGDNYLFKPDTNSLHQYENGISVFGKSKLTTYYFRVLPLFGIEFPLGKKHNGYLAAGPVVEILLGARQTNRYFEDNRKIERKLYGSENELFNLQSYQYGYGISAGYNKFGFWFATSLNSFFNQAEYKTLRTWEAGCILRPSF